MVPFKSLSRELQRQLTCSTAMKVKAGSNKDYLDIINYVKSQDLFVQANYDYVATKIDIDNYIDWYTCEICSGNPDMGNIRYWKTEVPGSKWKWIFFSFCWGFTTLNRH